MKKVLVMIVTVMSLGNGIMEAATSALPINETNYVYATDGYSKIEIKDIPEKVMQAVEKENPGCYFFEAYIGYQGGQTVYKIELIDQAGESFFIVVNDKGESIK